MLKNLKSNTTLHYSDEFQEVEKIIFNKTESTPSDWRWIWLQPAALLKKSTQKSNLIVQTKKKITTNLHQTTLQEKPTRPKKKRTRKVKQTTQQKTTTAEKMLYDLVISKTPKKLLKNQYWIWSRRLYTTMLWNLCKTIANWTRRKLSFLRHTKNSFPQKRSAP